jgi:membrane associated rhomboid family serine protease
LPTVIGRTVDAARLEREPCAWPDALWILAAAALAVGAGGTFLGDPVALPAAGAVAAQALILGAVIVRRERAAAQSLESFANALTRILIRSAPPAAETR